MFVKHCKVEVYLLELNLCENDNMDNVVTRHFSKADTIGMKYIMIFRSVKGNHANSAICENVDFCSLVYHVFPMFQKL